MDIFKKLNRHQIFEKRILCEDYVDEDDEADLAYSTHENSSQWLTGNTATSLEQRVSAINQRYWQYSPFIRFAVTYMSNFSPKMALLTAQCERQQLINIVVCALLVFCLAVTLHGKVCHSRNTWWFC